MIIGLQSTEDTFELLRYGLLSTEDNRDLLALLSTKDSTLSECILLVTTLYNSVVSSTDGTYSNMMCFLSTEDTNPIRYVYCTCQGHLYFTVDIILDLQKDFQSTLYASIFQVREVIKKNPVFKGGWTSQVGSVGLDIFCCLVSGGKMTQKS